VKLVTYNIRYSLGKDGVYDLERIVDAVRGADVIALQEVTRNFSHVPDADQPTRIAELLPDFYCIYGPPVDFDASLHHADERVGNRRLQFGNMLLARWPILSGQLYLLPRMRSYDVVNTRCGALEGMVDIPGGPLRVYSLHLGFLNHEERMAQLDYLLPMMLDVPLNGGAVSGPEELWNGEEVRGVPLSEDFVVLGDCNLKPDSPEYSRIVGEPDYYEGLHVVAQHLVDTWVRAGHPRDEGVTCFDEADLSESIGRLDYGFVSAGLAAKVKSAWIDDEASGSDHQPTWFELAL
jgi:endonuclease/exonuclease/phosphatase family metal-dependent hydrolase